MNFDTFKFFSDEPVSMSSELGVERPTTLALPESRMERRVHFSDVAGAQILSDEPTEENTTPSPKYV